MFSILPCKDADRLKSFPEGTTLLIYSEDGTERGHVAYRPYMSAIEILSMDIGESVDPDSPVSKDTLIHVDALVRAVGSIALGGGVLTLCTKLEEFAPMLTELGFFRNGEFLTLYLSKLFSKGCSGCNGCNSCK